MLARGLGPSGYGDLSFLLGSFVAIRSLVDVGASNAFFTFISQRPRGLRLYAFFSAIQLVELALMFVIIAAVMPDEYVLQIWVNNDRMVVILALLAAFLQQSVWQAIGQVGEAVRGTLLVQMGNLVVAVVNLGLMVGLIATGLMSIEHVFIATIVQYLGLSLVMGGILRRIVPRCDDASSIREIASEFWKYCRPMIWLSIFGGAYLFLDKWFLQYFGGSVEQGYFQIAVQFSLIGLLITSSILNVFWKEIAVAWEEGDLERVGKLYRYASRGLLLLSAGVAGVALPWAEEITFHFLGPRYVASWPVLAVMVLLPIFQSLTQINGAMLLACGHTKLYTAIGVFGMAISIPLSYLAVAPTNAVVPGAEMGAFGIAVKEVGTTFLMATIQSVAIATYHRWRFDGLFHIIAAMALLLLGWLSKIAVSTALAQLDVGSGKWELIFSLGLTGLLMLALLGILAVWQKNRLKVVFAIFRFKVPFAN
jgi:O-antigen/teichoic acid export membrane protein